MYAIRKWMFKPKKSDASVLAQFFHADEALNQVAAELDSFDGRKDPERCNALVNKLRHCQDKVLNVVEKIIQQVVPNERESRDFRVKFPDDVLQDSLAGQLWFGAECLAAGSSIMNREVESASMRPLAKALTRQLDSLRALLRDQCLKSQNQFTDKIKEDLLVFDKLFAEFELGYVSAMVPVKSMKEYDMLQEVTVLFCETVQRALELGLLTQDMIDSYDPALMFTIPRLAIVCGLLVNPEGPINPDKDPMNMSEMFRPFQMLLYKIRELLWTLSRNELWLLEKALSSTDENVPLTDEAFEQQLNRLNSLQQSRASDSKSPGQPPSTSCASVHHVANAAHDPGALSQPPLTEAVVSVCSHGDNAPGPQCLAVHSMPHQDSADSGMLSLPGDAGSDVVRGEGRGTIRTLHKAQSWPEHKRSRSSSQRARCQRQTSSGDCRGLMTSSAELLGGQPDVQRVLCTQSMGSNEFSFNLPQQTGQGAGALLLGDSGEEAQGTSEDSTQDTAVPTQENLNSEEDCDRIEQLTYIAGGMTSVLQTDPQLQGVAPPQDYNPPVGTSSSSGKAQTRGAIADRPKKTLAEISNLYKSRSCDTSGASSNPQPTCDRLQSKDRDSKATPSAPSKVLRFSEITRRPDPGDLEVTSQPDPAELSSSPDADWDRASSDTSSCTSDGLGDEEIVLAIQAAEVAARKDARARFKSSSELIHKLFVCISGVADQLQTNYASDFRHILKSVFECQSTQSDEEDEEEEMETSKDKIRGSGVSLEGRTSRSSSDSSSQQSQDSNQGNQDSYQGNQGQTRSDDRNTPPIETAEAAEPPPDWIPDHQAPYCSACEVPFTFVRRRHHCRNCGKVFCGRCSSNNVALPHYGHCKPVRVCNHCYMFQVTPFTVLQ